MTLEDEKDTVDSKSNKITGIPFLHEQVKIGKSSTCTVIVLPSEISNDI